MRCSEMNGPSSDPAVRSRVRSTPSAHTRVSSSSAGACHELILRTRKRMSPCTSSVVRHPASACCSIHLASKWSSSSSLARAEWPTRAAIARCSSWSISNMPAVSPRAVCSFRASHSARVATARTCSSSDAACTGAHGRENCSLAAASAPSPPRARICARMSSGGAGSTPAWACCARTRIIASVRRCTASSSARACLGTSCLDHAA
mmetsp:Transcript_26059/g.44447  ORF Transcript_26059/g.44447 Transcript_26059/m.44447 type:complete len:206 (-) Transcript_26059:234-851(-)